MIVIEGHHEDTLGSRSFCKKIPIPIRVEPNTITSGIAPNGVLVITAPVIPRFETPEEGVPHTTETSIKTQQQKIKEETEVEQQTTTETQTPIEEDFVIVPSGDKSETTSPEQTSPEKEDDMPKEISNIVTEDKFEV